MQGGGNGGRPDTSKVMRSAVRALRFRLDRVGRRLSALNEENQTLFSRLAFLRCENVKLHQARTSDLNCDCEATCADETALHDHALDKERSKLKSVIDGTSTPTAAVSPMLSTPTATSLFSAGSSSAPATAVAAAEQDPWTLPSATPGRPRLLADAMSPSTSSASLDAILSPRRLLTATPGSPPPSQQVAGLPLSFFGNMREPRSATSFQDVSEDPLFLCADLFEDNTSDDSMTTNVAGSLKVGSTDAAASTSTAAKGFSSTSTVASDVTAGPKDQQQTRSTTSLRPSERKRMKMRVSKDGEDAGMAEPEDRAEPKYSTSSSSLD
ncbi:unnamed protein product [Ixodes pacificus]